jgi:hypothetical protein
MAEIKLSRKEKVVELKKHHMKTFADENLEYDQVKYIPKMCYVPRGADEKVITFFKNEISGGEDIYTEFVSRDVESEDPDRILYLWKYNPHFEDEYYIQESDGMISERYWVPVSELIKVGSLEIKTPIRIRTVSGANKQQALFKEPEEDAPINELTIRDKVAIEWKLPVSNKEWLNNLIKDNFDE